MQVAAARAETNFCSATFEPTNNYPRCRRSSKISQRKQLFFETLSEFLAPLQQARRHNTTEGIEELSLIFYFLVPFIRFDGEELIQVFARKILHFGKIDIFAARE